MKSNFKIHILVFFLSIAVFLLIYPHILYKYFVFQMPLVALLNIWLLIYLNIKINLKMFNIDKLSGLLFIPYVLWLFFASFLNLFIVLNN